MAPKTYRIDRAYEIVYKYDKASDAYVYHTSFWAIDARREMKDSEIMRRVADREDECDWGRG